LLTVRSASTLGAFFCAPNVDQRPAAVGNAAIFLASRSTSSPVDLRKALPKAHSCCHSREDHARVRRFGGVR
jgi:hypothetical protein